MSSSSSLFPLSPSQSPPLPSFPPPLPSSLPFFALVKESLPLRTFTGTLLSTLSPYVGLLDASTLLFANRSLSHFLHRPLLLTHVHLVATSLFLGRSFRVLVMCSLSSLSLLPCSNQGAVDYANQSTTHNATHNTTHNATHNATHNKSNKETLELLTTRPTLYSALAQYTPLLDTSFDTLTHHSSRCTTLTTVLHILKPPAKTLLAWEYLHARIIASLPHNFACFDEAAFATRSVLSASPASFTSSLPSSHLLRSNEALSVDLFFRAASLVASIITTSGPSAVTLLPAFLEDCDIALFLRRRGHYRLQTDA